MARKTKRAVKAKAPASRRSWTALDDKLLLDLLDRIDRHIEVARAIGRANTPNDHHVHMEYQLRTVFGVMLDSQLLDLLDMRTRAENLCAGDMIKKRAQANSRLRLWGRGVELGRET
jgi:hypothetical protein